MLGALGFLTVLGPARTPDRGSLPWFPLVGAGIGGLLGALWWAAGEAFDPLLAGALVVAADLAVTGLLHVDGLADSADGLLPHLDRERRLEVMRAPDVGAFALAVVPAVLGLRWIALGTQAVEPLLLVGLWALSRTVVAVAPAVLPYARPTGLASAFVVGARPWVAIAALPAVAVCGLAVGWPGAVAAGAAVLAAGLVLAGAHRRIGGFTGDVLGAAIVVAETVGIVVTAARW